MNETEQEILEALQPTVASVDEKIRAEARGLLAQAHVSQAQLAKRLGVSQSSVSHMLSDRTYGLTLAEVYVIEAACRASYGTILCRAGAIIRPNVLELVHEIPGITDQAAEAIVAAILALRARIVP